MLLIQFSWFISRTILREVFSLNSFPENSCHSTLCYLILFCSTIFYYPFLRKSGRLSWRRPKHQLVTILRRKRRKSNELIGTLRYWNILCPKLPVPQNLISDPQFSISDSRFFWELLGSRLKSKFIHIWVEFDVIIKLFPPNGGLRSSRNSSVTCLNPRFWSLGSLSSIIPNGFEVWEWSFKLRQCQMKYFC